MLLIYTHQLVIKSLREKDCWYTKADKGNSIVILDKTDYQNRINTSISEGSYQEIKRNPLRKMNEETRKHITKLSEVFDKKLKWKLPESNPNVPKVYGLPKIHKPGNKMRLIMSNIGAPNYKLAKWLVSEIATLNLEPGKSVKNSFKAAEILSNIELDPGEILVSFDVTSLYPSVPVNEAIQCLENELHKLQMDDTKRTLYIQTAKLCMQQSYFQFNSKFYKTEHGVNMGNPFSSILAEIFMVNFENKLEEDNILPKNWIRYVDDVFTTIKESEIDAVLNTLNNRCQSIKFTFEKEADRSLPFLDLLLTRDINNKIDISIYRKPTHTNRLIPYNSHTPIQHKLAAFNSMIHRLINLPLSIDSYTKERNIIYQIAIQNGYQPNKIDTLIEKHSQKLRQMNISTLNREPTQSRKVPITFAPSITNKIQSIFNKHNLQVLYNSTNKLSTLLGSTKDKTPTEDKSGIYSIKCSDCNDIYIGQTRRKISDRFKEHIRNIKYNKPDRSSVAEHSLTHNHNIEKCNLKLLKNINNYSKLDAYESLLIIKNSNNTMNSDFGNIISPLFKLIK